MKSFTGSVILLALVTLTSAGCATRHDHYYWGHYEPLIYEMYLRPGSADAPTQIEKLTADIEQANSLGKPVPPGVYAQLGFMHAIAGNIARAESAFNMEKTNYPESAVLIDGMMQRARKAK
jgi:hypothetical protein